MKKLMALVAGHWLLITAASAAMPMSGFYRTIDDASGNSRSIVRLYECGNYMCGRVVALFNDNGTAIEDTIVAPTRRAQRISGNPYVSGLDIIWGMSWDGARNEFRGGNIMDPQNGRVFSSRMWMENDTLRVRGQIGPVGRTQTWHPIATADLPTELRTLDVSTWTPTTR
ncbi:MAG: DUF2147 domain-containing protein [Alphaproteobacteria bacterium]|nr:DUF2147 domain-containing protein [Alphaproteobacteria bacterium]